MIISNLSGMNANGSPNRKKTRFSEHPQVFEYSSRSKKEEQDNDSMLLDMDENNSDTNLSPPHRADRNMYQDRQTVLKSANSIEQMTSHLEFIEDFLNHNHEPTPQPTYQKTPIKLQQQPHQTPPSERQRFSVRIGPQLKSGRETLTVQQEKQVVDSIKRIPDQISNNKKRSMEPQNRQVDKNLEQRIEQQLKKKQRITMNVKDLMSMLNSYEKDDQGRKSCFNRITMDRFALSKMLEQEAANEEIIEQPQNEDMVTPAKTRKSMVFSAFKQDASDTQISLQISKYLSECNRRVDEAKKQNEYVGNLINEFRHEINRKNLQIKQCQRQNEDLNKHICLTNQKIKSMKKEIQRIPIQKCHQQTQDIQRQLGIKILKYQSDKNWNFYGHFQFQGLFMKIISRHKDERPQIKLSFSMEGKQFQRFTFSQEDYLKILKKFSKTKIMASPNMLDIALQVKRGYDNIRQLDLALKYLSLSIELVDFELGSNLDRLNFKIAMAQKVEFIVEISLQNYLQDPTNCKNISIYNTMRHQYLHFQVQKQQQLLYQLMIRVINSYFK